MFGENGKNKEESSRFVFTWYINTQSHEIKIKLVCSNQRNPLWSPVVKEREKTLKNNILKLQNSIILLLLKYSFLFKIDINNQFSSKLQFSKSWKLSFKSVVYLDLYLVLFLMIKLIIRKKSIIFPR